MSMLPRRTLAERERAGELGPLAVAAAGEAAGSAGHWVLVLVVRVPGAGGARHVGGEAAGKVGACGKGQVCWDGVRGGRDSAADILAGLEDVIVESSGDGDAGSEESGKEGCGLHVDELRVGWRKE
jgi:hypothetical protein